MERILGKIYAYASLAAEGKIGSEEAVKLILNCIKGAIRK